MARKVYLTDIALEEALKTLKEALEKVGGLDPLKAERVAVDEALGRITAQPVWAEISSPDFQAAAMDGIAVNAEDTYGASKTAPKNLKIGTQAYWVDTGGAMPEDCNAVIMVEDVQTMGPDEVEIRAAAAPWQHVRALGEDIVATELVLPENHRIRPQDLGALITAGITHVPVRLRPRVTIIPTGSELVQPGSVLSPGKIIEFNSLTLAKQIEEWGAEVFRYEIAPDDPGKITQAVKTALAASHIVIIGAGSSAGSKDYAAQVVAEAGEMLVHGIAIRPGHPCILGIAQGKPLIGLPGYPVSALLTSELIVKPIIYRMLGSVPPAKPLIKATITRKIQSPIGQEEFVRVTLGRVNERLIAAPLSRGAGITMSLVRADGVFRIPRFSEGIDSGNEIEVELWRSLQEIENTILAIGSHDMALDLLASLLHKHHPDCRLTSAHVGSLGGLLALKRGEAHLAGCHLLDELSGQYNVSHIKQVMPGQETVLLNLVYREQGLILAKGNPKNIRGLSDLGRKDVIFINRQRGSGTRVLLDYKLKQNGLDPDKIIGYQREQTTHTGVAATVAGGAADVGLGILAAARALGLEFIPLLKEEYDLAIPCHFYESRLLKPLLEVIRSPEFQDTVVSLGGYDVSETGTVKHIIN
jgi:putative molybdopterin biosynthesis protein